MAPSFKLPILALTVREQRYSCHGCGNCCRDFTVQLREDDLVKLREQKWEEKLGEPVTVAFRGVTYLRQRQNGACIFLMNDGKCRIHAEHGFEAKPIACQLFPFHLTPVSKGPGAPGIRMGINFACQSVLENKGADLRSHVDDLQRMAGRIAEVGGAALSQPPMLNDRLRAEPLEVDFLSNHIDKWLRRSDTRLRLRLDGLAWVIEQLARAKLDNVRGKRLDDLLEVLFGALPEELEHHPIDPPTSRQKKMLRQAVFGRVEDPKLNVIEKRGAWRIKLGQLARSRRFRVGRGIVPRIGVEWPEDVRFDVIDNIAAAPSNGGMAVPAVHKTSTGGTPVPPISDAAAIDHLMTRWLRASILGNRCWGAGYYAWPMIPGVQALLLNAACVGWLARVHAAPGILRGEKTAIDITDVRAAIGRIDRAAGRAPWLGGTVERLRLRYLQLDEGLRRLLDAFALV